MSVLEGKNIAILGGTGTVGQAMVRFIEENSIGVNKILIYSRDEIKQLEMMEDFPEDGHPKMEYKIGDVRDLERLKEILGGVDFVIHAAAIKHVVMAEKNPEECFKTNVFGTQNVINACADNGISKAILVSTDKAVNPIGVYGKSKKKAEEIWQEANTSKDTRFKTIRLGNIIGARGSVFEVFERQKKKGVIRVTHPDATRFCISQEKTAEHLLSLLENNLEEIFTPPMDSFSVMNLAKQIAPECEIEIIGLRLGDKLHEESEGVSSELNII